MGKDNQPTINATNSHALAAYAPSHLLDDCLVKTFTPAEAATDSVHECAGDNTQVVKPRRQRIAWFDRDGFAAGAGGDEVAGDKSDADS